MTTVRERERPETLADLLERLGGIDAARIRLKPAPGAATEADLAEEKPICELVEGTLVEKAVGYAASVLAVALLEFLQAFVRTRNRGLVSGPDGLLRLFPGLARAPDIAFVSWARMPGRKRPKEPVPGLVPDLVVEVLSEGNRPAEMGRKRGEYFQAGVRLVWEIDPEGRTVAVYREPDAPARTLSARDTLEGGRVLPGFKLPLADLFSELDRQGP